ncbi:MAG: BatD family protein [Saprospiraceae bacterium]
MKKLLTFIASFMISLAAFSQQAAKLTVEVSNDSILLGNYIEVKFTIENASVKNFEAPNFDGFTIVSGLNQSSSMMISNGNVSQTMTYSYYIEPVDVGNYFIQPAFVDTEEGPLESIPLEVLVVDNPDGIIQQPQQKNRQDFFNRDDFFGGNDLFGGDSFFGGNDFFDDFFNSRKNPLLQEDNGQGTGKTKKKKKKRKVYKL